MVESNENNLQFLFQGDIGFSMDRLKKILEDRNDSDDEHGLDKQIRT